MAIYSFWNNKGGVGKSFLCFITASEYAFRHPESDVYVLDLCPQATFQRRSSRWLWDKRKGPG